MLMLTLSNTYISASLPQGIDEVILLNTAD